MAVTTESLIIPASEYKTILTLNNGLTTILLTAETLSWSSERESETIHAIGQQEPIGNKRNNAKYSGNISLQAGEIETFLRLAGLVESTQIESATLAITSLTPAGPQRIFGGLNINSESLDIKSKDKQSIYSLKWEALTVTGIAIS
jgi:hypothetical protein